jgi:hypothetical protein
MFRVYSSEFRVQGLGFRVKGAGCRVLRFNSSKGYKFRVWD